MIPTLHDLGAAIRVLSVLSTEASPRDSVRAIYGLLPSDGVFTADDYQRGESLLVEFGVVIDTDAELRLASDVPDLSQIGVRAGEMLLADLLQTGS